MENRLRIGQFSDSFLPIVDGVGRVVFNYCETLGRKGHEVYCVAPMEDMGYRGDHPFEIIDYYSTNLPNTVYNAGIPDLDPHFKKRLEMCDLDIVHVHTPFIAGAEGLDYAKKKGIPVIGSFHSKYYDDFLQMTGSKHLAGLGTDVIVRFYESCDEVWTVSENSADTLESYGYSKPIYVIPNGMDIKDVGPELAIMAKEHFKLKDVPLLLYVGQINKKKNIERILESCSLLKKDGIPFQLVLAGKGPHEEELSLLARKLGIGEDTLFTGHIQDEDLLDGLYAASDLFVFPSLYDTYSMVVREAANATTASVVVRGSAPAECIIDKENGYLCEDDNTSLYEVIKEALSDKERLEAVGLNAKLTIPVSWESVIDEALKRYEYILGR